MHAIGPHRVEWKLGWSAVLLNWPIEEEKKVSMVTLDTQVTQEPVQQNHHKGKHVFIMLLILY